MRVQRQLPRQPIRRQLPRQNNQIMIIFGLGNPGKKYEKTRHNAGFLFIEELSRSLSIPLRKKILEPYRIGRKDDLSLVEPLTYMNSSGIVFPGITAGSEFLVAVDNMDLPVGSARLRKGGSSAGHNGLKSIISAVGNDFYRLYIGIGRPDAGMDVASYVLSRFPDEDLEKLSKFLPFLSENILSLYNGERYELVVQRINSAKF